MNVGQLESFITRHWFQPEARRIWSDRATLQDFDVRVHATSWGCASGTAPILGNAAGAGDAPGPDGSDTVAGLPTALRAQPCTRP